MWKSIKNISSAVMDVAAIAGKELVHQVGKASEFSGVKTDLLAKKASELRQAYEDNLLCRKEGVDGILVVRRHEDVTDVE